MKRSDDVARLNEVMITHCRISQEVFRYTQPPSASIETKYDKATKHPNISPPSKTSAESTSVPYLITHIRLRIQDAANVTTRLKMREKR